MTLVNDPNRIRLAMLGMVDGNGHPCSWSAIINGRYDPAAIVECGYPNIVEYLDAEPAESLGISGVTVTHVWCQDRQLAETVARAGFIENIADSPEDVIGQVDAVVIPTDIGFEHVDRARPFIEAGLPMFIDKPLTDREDHLRQFVAWKNEGKAILSSSCMRYAREFVECRRRLSGVGEIRLITNTTPKTWERYGIHALEGVYPFLPPGGWQWVVNSGTRESNIVHIRHECGADVVLAAVPDMYGAFGCLNIHGTKDSLSSRFKNPFHAFKTQLETFIGYLRTGQSPIDFSETVELMKIIICGIRSRDEDGRKVRLSEIHV